MVRAPVDGERCPDRSRRLLLAPSLRDLVRPRRRHRRPARVPPGEHRLRRRERRCRARRPDPLPHGRPAARSAAGARVRGRAARRAGPDGARGDAARAARAGRDDARARDEPLRRGLARRQHARRAARGRADRRRRADQRARARRGDVRGVGVADVRLRPGERAAAVRGRGRGLLRAAARGISVPVAHAARAGDRDHGARHEHARRRHGRRPDARLRRPRARQRRRPRPDGRRDGADGVCRHARLRLDRSSRPAALDPRDRLHARRARSASSCSRRCRGSGLR